MKTTMTIEEEIRHICYDHYEIIEPLTKMVERRLQEALDSLEPCSAHNCYKGKAVVEQPDKNGRFPLVDCEICSGRGFVCL